jgi:DNA-directed RNA polymerase specialized sigma24 family protein
VSEASDFQELIRRVRAGDQAAAEELVKGYEAAIRRKVRIRLLNQPARRRLLDSSDICQSVLKSFFYRVQHGQYELHTPQQLVQLLATMARNKLISQARKAHTGLRQGQQVQGGDMPLDEVMDPDPTPEEIVAVDDYLRQFRQRLTPEEGQLLDLRDQGLAWDAIATRLGGGAEALRKRLARACQRIRSQLGTTAMREPAHEDIHALLTDQRQRWHRGQRVQVEFYLNRRPALRSDPEALLDLVYQEKVLREEQGEAPQLEEYLRRFPQLGAELRKQFEVDETPVSWPEPKEERVTPDPPVPPAPPGYRDLEELGRGAMGVVYKAYEVATDRHVALNKGMRLWLLASGQELYDVAGVTGPLAFSPDGTRLVAVQGDQKTVRVLSAATGKELFQLSGHTEAVTAVAFRADGKQLATAGRDGSVRIWDLRRGKELRANPTGSAVRALAFRPDGRQLATVAEQDRRVHVWATGTGQLQLTLEGHNFPVTCVAYSPDGRRLATGATDRTVRLWDAATGQALLTLGGATQHVHTVTFSANGERLAAGEGEDLFTGELLIWDARPAEEKQEEKAKSP